MDDETTIDHGRDEFQRAPAESPELRRSRGSRRVTESARSVVTSLGCRPTERYVPSAVTCEQCGCAGEAFTWFQRVPAGDVDGQRPTRELSFCGLVCLSWYYNEEFEGYSPPPLPTGIPYRE
jgi:hypothetical protein